MKKDSRSIGLAGKIFVAAALIAVPAFAIPQKVTARTAQEVTFEHSKYIGLATLLYAQDHRMTYPGAKSTSDIFKLLAPYAKAKDVFVSLNPNSKRFLFNMALASAPVSGVLQPATTVVAYDEKEWPGRTRVVVFADGHAEIVSRSNWLVDSKSLTFKIAPKKQ